MNSIGSGDFDAIPKSRPAFSHAKGPRSCGHCDQARAAGATIVSEPEDKFWGDRCYEALDPERHRWRFHQHTGRRFDISG